MPPVLGGKRALEEFPVATLTNYHTLSGLKQNIFLLLQSEDQKSKISFTGPKSRYWQAHASSRVSRGAFVSLPCPASRAAFLAFPGLFLHLQSQHSRILLQQSHCLLLYQISLCHPLKSTLVSALRAPLGNPG